MLHIIRARVSFSLLFHVNCDNIDRYQVNADSSYEQRLCVEKSQKVLHVFHSSEKLSCNKPSVITI